MTYGNEGAGHLSVAVSPELAGSTPTGTVTVHDSTTTLCTIELSLGQESYARSGIKLVPGTYGLGRHLWRQHKLQGLDSCQEDAHRSRVNSRPPVAGGTGQLGPKVPIYS